MIVKESPLERNLLPYKNLSQRFKSVQKDIMKQFAYIYIGRLKKMYNEVLSKSIKKWGNEITVRGLSELAEENQMECIVIGTLHKDQQLKPSILKELSEENQLIPQPPRSKYTTEEDSLILEDDSQRIRLCGVLDVKGLATGIVVGLKGRENEDGKFIVDDYCFTGTKISPERPISSLSDDRFVVLISGLNLKTNGNLLSIKLMTDWISGISGSPTDQENSSKIARVIIAGNSVAAGKEEHGIHSISETNTLEAVKFLDEILLDLVETVPVDLMPGEWDPANHCLPQQPFHPCMFPKACSLETFKLVSNPYECQIGDLTCLGTSGQPIGNLERVTEGFDRLELLEKTLEWGHLSPTSPDTLSCYPYYEDDPFVIEEQPDIYFAGCQPSFQTKIISNGSDRQVCLVTVPSFSETSCCALINLRTLYCTTMAFKIFPTLNVEK